MSGYLEEYGAGETKRENFIRNSILTGVTAIVLGILAIYLFRLYPEISLTKRFLNGLRARDYAGAYQTWGCSPCKEYPYSKFMEDWGPGSAGASSPILKIRDSESCGTGVLLTVEVSAEREERLWVENHTKALGFSPVPACRGKSSWAIMVHRTVGRLRQVFY